MSPNKSTNLLLNAMKNTIEYTKILLSRNQISRLNQNVNILEILIVIFSVVVLKTLINPFLGPSIVSGIQFDIGGILFEVVDYCIKIGLIFLISYTSGRAFGLKNESLRYFYAISIVYIGVDFLDFLYGRIFVSRQIMNDAYLDAPIVSSLPKYFLGRAIIWLTISYFGVKLLNSLVGTRLRIAQIIFLITTIIMILLEEPIGRFMTTVF